jgi:hypothetical protein
MIDQVTFEQYLEEQLKDMEFRKAWEDFEPAYQLKRLRLLKRLSPADLESEEGWTEA